jgi:P4 family phage/plasmid primase-like protien
LDKPKVKPKKLEYDVNWEVPKDEGTRTQSRTGRGIGQILEDNFRFAKDIGTNLYYYDGGVYKVNAEDMIRLQTKRVMMELGTISFWKPTHAEHAIAFVKASAVMLAERPHTHCVNTKSGYVLINGHGLVKHDPDYITTVQLPVVYDKDAKCTAWEKFISEVFPLQPETDLVWRMIAWLMIPHTFSQKALMLLGEGANGKSTLLEAIISFLGRENVSNLSLARMNDRFSVTSLMGKLANIVPDLSEDRIKDTSIFKQLAVSEEVTAEIKHGAVFKFKPFARHVFSSFKMPESDDTSHGFYRRFDTIKFLARFESDPEKGKRIQKDLSKPSELSGVLNKAISVALDVGKYGVKVPECFSIGKEEHEQENNPIGDWLDDELEKNQDGFVAIREVYRLYQQHAGRWAVSINKFGKLLKSHFDLQTNKKQKMADVDGIRKLVWCYVGVKLKGHPIEIEGDDLDIGGDDVVM